MISSWISLGTNKTSKTHLGLWDHKGKQELFREKRGSVWAWVMKGLAGSMFQAEEAACVKTVWPMVYLRIQKVSMAGEVWMRREG